MLEVGRCYRKGKKFMRYRRQNGSIGGRVTIVKGVQGRHREGGNFWANI